MAAALIVAAAGVALLVLSARAAAGPALEQPALWPGWEAADPGGAAFWAPGGELYWGAMRTSQAGIQLIKSFEGGPYLMAYQDPGGVWTIGWGHTGPDVVRGATITAQRAEELLAADVAAAEAAVNAQVMVPLRQGQFDALVSFVFNVGQGAFAASTLLRQLNQGDYAGAAAEFDRWVYDEGVRLAGLVRRRDAEQALFLA